MSKFLRPLWLSLALIACLSLAGHSTYHDVFAGDTSAHCGLCHTSSIAAANPAPSGIPTLYKETAPLLREVSGHSISDLSAAPTRAPPSL